MEMISDFLVSRALTVVTNKVETEIFKVLGVNKEIKTLQERLETIKGYLQQTEQKRHINDTTDIWMRKLKDIMYDADDVIDLCMIEGEKLLKAQALSDTPTVSIPCNYIFSSFRCLRCRHDIANQIRTLNDKLEELNKDMPIKQHLDQTTKEAIESVERVIPHETSHLQVEDIVGTQIENDIETLVSLILKNNPEKCRVFGVVGTGGIGKSTLASKIFDDERIRDNFPNRRWLYISQNYTESDLLKKLISSEEGSEDLEGKSKVELENKVMSVLTQNTFIVLDDIWNSSVWVYFLNKLIMKSATNCTILVTSRKEKVVMRMKPTYIHQVQRMDEESGWTLLKQLVFEGEEEEYVISSFKEIGIKLVNKCDGLPLVIKAIAGVLHRQNKAKWEEVFESDAWNMGQIEEELRPLYLSYEDLPSKFKQCFLYCSLYPHKETKYYEKIVQFWAAEGLIMCDQDEWRLDLPNERSMEDIGDEIYRELICRNLLETDVDLEWFRQLQYFSMHDNFRSLCANLMREEGILYRHGREFKADGNVKIRRLSVSYMGPNLELPEQIIRQACLRTLILTHSPKTKMIHDSVLQALPRLRVLDLSVTSIEKIPDCIGDLLHLRYLDLYETNIREIPTTIGNLINLQSLDVYGCRYLERLPVSITELHNLRWINMYNCPLLTYVPKGIGKLENFCILRGFMVGQDDSATEEGCDLEELKNLSKLRGITILRLERAKGGAVALANKPFLKQLILEWMPPDEEAEDDNGGGDEAKSDEESDSDGKDDEDAKNDMGYGNDDGSAQQNQSEEAEEDENEEAESQKEQKRWSEEQISKAERICNEMTQPASTIAELLFVEYPGRQFPSWMTSSSLAESFPNLAYLVLEGLPCCTELPPLGTLPQLKYLRIQSASAVTAIGSQFLGSRSSAFPKLEVLRFIDMPQWEEWTFDGTPLAVKLFPSLRECNITNCPKLRALPDDLHRATNLNELFLHKTYALAEINNLPLAYKLEVTNGRGLKKISNIPSLRYLEVDDFLSLERVEHLDKLQHLVLICSKETEQLPRWLPSLIQQHNNTTNTHRSLRKLEMQCNLRLLKSCLRGNDWEVIQQISYVKVETYSGKDYIRYTKDPYIFDAYVTSD